MKEKENTCFYFKLRKQSIILCAINYVKDTVTVNSTVSQCMNPGQKCLMWEVISLRQNSTVNTLITWCWKNGNCVSFLDFSVISLL